MSLYPRSMAHHRVEEKQIGAAVSSSSSLESVNSADVDVSLGSTESKSTGTRSSLPNLASAKALDEPIKDWQNIIQPLLTGEADGSNSVVPAAFQAWLDLFSSTPHPNQGLAGSSRNSAGMPAFSVPPAPPLPVQIPITRKTKKSQPSPPAVRPLLPSRPPDYSALLGSSPPTTNEQVHAYATKASSPPTVLSAGDRYRCYLEAGTSMMTQHGEDTLTYLNKGQFYGIVIEARPETVEACRSSPRQVQSVVSLVFREEKDEDSELHHWEYWHLQQPNQLLRAFDVDRKSASSGVVSIEDLAHNATSFLWDASQLARATLRVNCLSTEFSPQKGVRGMPLFLQVDTYEDLSTPEAEASHRCYCKIKSFRDKGAERKNKDESKSADRRMAKILKQQQHSRRRGSGHRPAPFPSSASCLTSSTVLEAEQEVAIGACAAPPWPGPQTSLTSPSGFFQSPSRVTILTTTSTLGRRPVLFNPSALRKSLSLPQIFDSTATASAAQSAQLCALIQDVEQGQRRSLSANPESMQPLPSSAESMRQIPGTAESMKDKLSDLDMGSPRRKNPRTERQLPTVTVYVRKEEETIYNAIMLDQLTVQELSFKVASKYDVPNGVIKNVYKRTKRGILVNLDDRMVQQFVNEDDFIIQLMLDTQHMECDLFLHY